MLTNKNVVAGASVGVEELWEWNMYLTAVVRRCSQLRIFLITGRFHGEYEILKLEATLNSQTIHSNSCNRFSDALLSCIQSIPRGSVRSLSL